MSYVLFAILLFDIIIIDIIDRALISLDIIVQSILMLFLKYSMHILEAFSIPSSITGSFASREPFRFHFVPMILVVHFKCQSVNREVSYDVSCIRLIYTAVAANCRDRNP